LIGREVDVSNNGPGKGKKYELWAWLLFVIPALFFIASSIRNGDIIGLLGGISSPWPAWFSLFVISAFAKAELIPQKRIEAQHQSTRLWY